MQNLDQHGSWGELLICLLSLRFFPLKELVMVLNWSVGVLGITTLRGTGTLLFQYLWYGYNGFQGP